MTEAPVEETDKFRVTDLVNMPAENAVTALLEQSADLKASDLFLMAEERFMTIAVRRLGMMEKLAVVATDHGRQMITHIKANADMDISERRRPSDGRWIHQFGDRTLDLRINSVPTLHGEDMTVRIWDHSAGLFALSELGMSRSDMNKLTFMLNHSMPRLTRATSWKSAGNSRSRAAISILPF